MTNQYFQELNYTLANEDTTLEFEMIKRGSFKKIFSVGGSGSRCLPFLALPIESLDIVDVSPFQLKLIAFKLRTIKELSREDAIALWHGEDSQRRNKLLDQMGNAQMWKGEDAPPLYWGKWERTFGTFAKLAGVFFSEKTRRGIFTAQNPYEYYLKHIKGWKWSLILRILGNKAIFNSILYKGHFIKKNSELSYFDYYEQAFDRLFHLEVKKSHFLQMCFFGRVIHEEALPLEFQPGIFESIKASPVNPIYHEGSAFEVDSKELDFVSLSDVPSYLTGIIEKEFNQRFMNRLQKDGLIVNRHYLRVPEMMNLDGLLDVSEEFKTLSSQELVQMYQVQVLKKKGP